MGANKGAVQIFTCIRQKRWERREERMGGGGGGGWKKKSVCACDYVSALASAHAILHLHSPALIS